MISDVFQNILSSSLNLPIFVVESHARRLSVFQKYLAELSPPFLRNHIIVGRPFALGKPPNAANANVEGEAGRSREGIAEEKAVARYR